MKTKYHNSVSAITLGVIAMLVSPATASAQVDEIIVTATKHSATSLQDIAGSVSAITADSLETAQVEGFEDYIKLVPGLTSVSSGPGQSQIVIRGVNATRVIHSSTQSRSLAGLYFDEMPISIAGFNPDLGVVDIERIEVLRGPQGTLYGASSMSGTIRVITKKPDTEEFTGHVGAKVSTTTDGGVNHQLKGSTNIPLSDNVAIRMSAFQASKGGFIDNVAPGNEEEDTNSEQSAGARMQLGYFGEKLDLVGSVMYNKLESDGPPDEYAPSATDARVAPITDELQTIKFTDDFFSQEFLALNLTADYDFGAVKMTSATSFFDVEIDKQLDDLFRILAVTPVQAPFSTYQAQDTSNSFIQELRFASNTDSALEWVIGGYYESNERQFVQTQPTPGLNAFFVSIGGPPPCPTIGGTCFGAVADSVFDGDDQVKTDQYALFGEATYNINDALRVKLGLRYFDYQSDVDILASGVANGGVTTTDETIKEDGFVPKVEVSYDISDDHMVYATYSEGFRVGGVNGFTPAACDADLVAVGSSQSGPFNSDTLTNYEAGAKTAWMENRVTANVAVFRNVFDGIQSNIALPTCGFSQTLNAGKIENTGFEGEFAFAASDALTLRGGLAYVNSEVTEASPSINVVGDTPPYVPEFTASASVDYGVPIGNGEGHIRTDLRYVSSSFNEYSSVATATKLPSYTIVDLFLGYDFNDSSIGVFATNLFNDDIITNIDPDRNQPNQLSRGTPRTMGVSFNQKF